MIFRSGEMAFSIRRLKNVVAELCHPTIYKVGSFGGERTVGQRTAIDGYGEDARSHAGTNAHGGILDDDGLPGLQPAGFLQPDEIGVGGRLSAGDVVGGHDFAFGEKVVKIVQEPAEEWSLPAAGDDEDLQSGGFKLFHQFHNTLHDGGGGE